MYYSHPSSCHNGSIKCILFNPLPHDKVLDWSKLKSFAEDKKKKKNESHIEIPIGKGRKYCGKRRKCS